MARQNRDTKAIMNSVQRNRLRSNLFRWMVRHHDSIIERWNGERIDWRTFCAELAALGLLFLLVLFYILILTRAYVLGLKVPCNYFATEISASYGIPRDVILVSLLGARWWESK